ncbi:hypothetical protein PZB74_00240 [Porifericola rhodea]|uniref:hypothetical protein n=1 Tax=Porifericola rhodea TaxID=930972 RepID=UPI002666A0D0|nr:hypothetical protein [Porifericola rhodea]WKN31786.1 hypothetical protein PZB74_00240 [Porifericola rhodea]
MKSYYHHIFFLIVFCFSLYFARYIPAEQASSVVGLIAMIVTFFHGLQSIAYLSTGLRSRSPPPDSHQKFSAAVSIGAQYGIVCGAGFLTG